MSYLKLMADNKAKAFKPAVQAEHCGGLDVLIVSPKSGGGTPPLHVVLKKEQIGSPECHEFLAFIKAQKVNGIWAFTYSPKDKVWYQVDGHGDPGNYKLKDWFAGEDVRTMLGSDTVKSLTYKESIQGNNISRAQAEANSDDWVQTESNLTDIDNIPSCNDHFIADDNESTPGSNVVTPVKPPTMKRKR